MEGKAMKQNVVTVNQVKKVYGKKGSEQYEALKKIDFSVGEGEFVGIMGPSGSGKTTLGNYFKTIKPNYFIGIRTPWTLENEEVWKKTHLFGGKLWFIGGLLIFILSLIIPDNYSFYVLITVTVIISILPIIYSYLEFKKLKA